MHTEYDYVSKYFKTNFSNSFSSRINFELSVYFWLEKIFSNYDMSSVSWGIIFQTVLGWVRSFKMWSLLLYLRSELAAGGAGQAVNVSISMNYILVPASPMVTTSTSACLPGQNQLVKLYSLATVSLHCHCTVLVLV